MNTLFIFNDNPADIEKAFHGLRLAAALLKQDASDVRIFLFADGVRMVEAKSNTAYDISELFAEFAKRNIPVAACVSCLDKRGLADAVMPKNALPATLNEAVEWTTWADKVLVY